MGGLGLRIIPVLDGHPIAAEDGVYPTVAVTWSSKHQPARWTWGNGDDFSSR